MKMIRLILSCFLAFGISISAFAQSDDSGEESLSKLKKLVEYLYNLGTYLGYDLNHAATEGDELPSQILLNSAATQLVQNYAFNSMLGAMPVNALSTTLAQFVPTNFETYAVLNYFANYTFKSQPYNSSGQGKITVNPLIDQPTYQNEPVSQAVLNILGTPDYTYCMSYDATTWDTDCKLLYQNQVASNVIGNLPQTNEFFTYNYIQKFLSQLNSNTLIAPLLYSQDTPESTSSSSGGGQNQGLNAQTQAQAAQNFIRYASGAVSPISLPKRSDYSALYNQAINLSGNVPLTDQKQAQAALANYLASLRTYAAQASVGHSNLYFILSKRMPQNQSSSGSNITSQAMSEFTMATRRLYEPTGGEENKKQWLDQINSASAATVQKEIAILLAEINYQLYLNRQQEERILLTNSLQLLQSLTKPSVPEVSSVKDGEE